MSGAMLRYVALVGGARVSAAFDVDAAVANFRHALGSIEEDEIVDRFLVSGEPAFVSLAGRAAIASGLARAFGVAAGNIAIYVSGSAKLGFSLVEIRKQGVIVKERYRPFGPDSDIDVAVVSLPIFEALWLEISNHAHRSTKFLPWDAGKLSGYLLNGWWRPDHFPKSPLLRRCRVWWECFDALSIRSEFGGRKVRGGLFYSTDHLRQYLARSVRECMAAEANSR